MIRIIHDDNGGDGHECALGILKYAPAGSDITIAPSISGTERIPADEIVGRDRPDLVFVLNIEIAERVRRILNEREWAVPLIGAVGWTGLDRLPALFEARHFCDALFFSNREHWRALGPLPNSFPASSGIDQEIFRVVVPPDQREQKVIWAGTERDLRDKDYENLILPLQERLSAKGIEFEARLLGSNGVGKLKPTQRAEWYNQATVIVCASESEERSHLPLEAAACGCTIVSTAIGNMPELIENGQNGFLVPRNVDAFETGVLRSMEKYIQLSKRLRKNMRRWLWQFRVHEVMDLFDIVRATWGVDSAAMEKAGPLDIFDEVTVFLTTVGAPTYKDCLERVAKQDSLFRFVIIENMAPLADALQHMLDTCKTRYFVQLDEDMLLYPHAIRRLYEEISSSDKSVAIYVGNLFDVHLERTIQGIKIFRTDIVQKYPWTRTTTVFQRNRAIVADGYRIRSESVGATTADAFGTLGLHGTKWTPQHIYERYFTLRRWRATVRDVKWIDKYEAIFLARFLKDQNRENFFALTGLIAGALVGDKDTVWQKDFRRLHDLPGFDVFLQLYDELSAAVPRTKASRTSFTRPTSPTPSIMRNRRVETEQV